MGEFKRRYFAANGVTRSTIVDGDTVTIHTQQNLDDILDSIKRDREIMPNNGRVGRLEGRLPLFMVAPGRLASTIPTRRR